MFRRARMTGSTNPDTETIEVSAVSSPARSSLTPVAEWPDIAGKLTANPASPTSSFSTLFAGVCRYYHDCFSADSRGGILTNVLDKNQAEYLTFADGRDVLLTGAASQLEMPLATARHRAERRRCQPPREVPHLWVDLPGGSRALSERSQKGELYCAPLLYWPARIEHEGSQAWLAIDLDEQRINFPLLASLIDAENDEQAQAYAEAILAQVPTAPFDVEAIREFSSVIARTDPRSAHRRPAGLAGAADRGGTARPDRAR